MNSSKPYLIRAIYDWCIGNNLTPYVSVVEDRRSQIPAGYAQDGLVTLNIGPEAVSSLELKDDLIILEARFGEKSLSLMLAIDAVSAIFAKENGDGLRFHVESIQPEEDVLSEKKTADEKSCTEDAKLSFEKDNAKKSSHLKRVQ